MYAPQPEPHPSSPSSRLDGSFDEVAADSIATNVETTSILKGATLPALHEGRPVFEITPEEEAAIKTARSTFRISVLRGQVRGEERLVYIAGETHMKSAIAAENAKALLGCFEHFAVEGVFPNSFGAHVMSAGMRPMVLILKFLRSLSGGAIRGTTIREIVRGAKESETLDNVLFLEKGDRPSLLREASMTAVGGTMLSLWAVTAVAYASVLFPSVPVFSETFETMLNILAPVWGYIALSSTADLLFPRALQRSKILQVLSFPIYDAVVGRNEAMARNLVRHLDERPEVKKILLVAGNAHRKGLAVVLQRDFGFREENQPPSKGTEASG